jgi:hypothetical protein
MRDDTHASEEFLSQMENEADSRIDPLIRRVMDQIDPFWRVFC